MQIYETPKRSLEIWAGGIAPAYLTMPPEQRAIVLLRLVARHCDVAMEEAQITLARPNWEASTQFFQWPVDLQIQALKRDFPGGGLNCAGLSTVLAQAILDVEGWPVWLLHVMNGAASHTVVMTEAEPGRVIILDPMFSYFVADASGDPLDLESLLTALSSGNLEEVQLLRPEAVGRWLWYMLGMDVSDIIDGTYIAHPDSRIKGVPDARLCWVDDWSIDLVSPGTSYGNASKLFLEDRDLIPDFRNMFLCPREIQPLITASTASTEALAAVAHLGSFCDA